ncbi:DnaD domain-containing protein [Bacillus sp. DTU_2020_1000418_1_SI_GHA_SEK_038]|uniref:DnaD domain-containing protein n=1 Tax=Bacillus sp. DTU_2020_1000418_1_SI_GHA_SEK_038 TaxID=3077585 RepID=UPI0028EE5269|nr:DnaD domain-containing protein [Bacillus sp. DTU_2020_1000418_1_SI_GHA_SEK_038]WNS74000.1 DnaD domain-containing protein [Bacillus sp. DTU_2020_1000418_1_SI_GHA_SEK_038]
MSKTSILKWLQEGNITIPGVLLTHYKEMNLNEHDVVLILHVISYIEKGNSFPTPVEISSSMTISVSECTAILRRLIQKGYIEIKDNYTSDGIRYEMYNIDPLWEKLVEHFLMKEKLESARISQQSETDLYTCFEQEFGRPLSPFECETLALWMDDDRHDPHIIKAALREAVISGKLNFRYIDRILFEWKKNGIKTIEQAKSYGKKFRQNQQQRGKLNEASEQPGKTIPFYNWLEQ